MRKFYSHELQVTKSCTSPFPPRLSNVDMGKTIRSEGVLVLFKNPLGGVPQPVVHRLQ